MVGGVYTIPSLLYVVPLLLAFFGVAALLWAIQPPTTDWTVVSFAPWMAIGSVLFLLDGLEAYPAIVAPLFGPVTVYVTTAIFAGFVWILMTFIAGIRKGFDIYYGVGVFGGGVALMLVVFLFLTGINAQTFNPVYPVFGTIVAALVTALAWVLLSLTYTDVARYTGRTGAFVVFAHSLDGVSTALGYDLLGAGERTPLSRVILEFSGSLPTAQYVGAGWLFVVVKVVLALVIVAAFREYLEESPRRARLVLAFVAAVGFGPGVYNLLQFTLTDQDVVFAAVRALGGA
ncbi:DUF63 family protein [Halorubellus litoreus]|uniref:DUF63 family protein n=1 Tax=Halorubellus litoreus TaxID=755308 RepID=A0ABD5VID4_9EURY